MQENSSFPQAGLKEIAVFMEGELAGSGRLQGYSHKTMIILVKKF